MQNYEMEDNERDFLESDLLEICQKLSKEVNEIKKEITFSKKQFSLKEEFFYRMALDICLNKIENSQDLLSLTSDFLSELSPDAELSDPDYHQVVNDLEDANHNNTFCQNILDILSTAKIDHKIIPESTQDLYKKLKQSGATLDKSKIDSLKELKSLELSSGEFAQTKSTKDYPEEIEPQHSKPMQEDDDTVAESTPPLDVDEIKSKNPLENYPHFTQFGKPPIAEASILQNLIKIADDLDKLGLHKEAEVIDIIITKVNKRG